MKKRFIEWDLPLSEISKESAKEKNIRHGHPSTLHIWWARRPLASSRVTNLAALIDLPDNPQERKKIIELIKRISKWEAVKNGNNADIKKAQELIKRQWGNTPPKVLDPFGGGGSIALEALRLGCETYSNDLNPVAVLIQKATLEWPQRFGKEIEIEEEVDYEGLGKAKQKRKVNQLAYYIGKYAKLVLDEVKKEIGRFYPDDPDGYTPVGYIWARTLPCQNISCGIEIPLIKQFWLCKKENKRIAYKLTYTTPSPYKNPYTIRILENDEIDFDPSEGTVKRGDVCCPLCGNVIKAKDTHKLFQKNKDSERMVAVVLYKRGVKGKRYRVANEDDLKIFSQAESYIEERLKNWKWDNEPLPEEFINSQNPERELYSTRCIKYGFKQWKDLFNSRQRLTLVCFLDKIKELGEKWKVKSEMEEELRKAIVGYLGICLNRIIVDNTKLSTWGDTRETVRDIFNKQAIAMTWDFIEGVPISETTMGFLPALDWVLRVIAHCSFLNKDYIGSLTNSSATTLPYPDNYFDLIATDPPYYDAINYAELSDFFYVWLKKSVGDLFPDIFATPLTPKSQEAVANPVRHGSAEKAKEHFEKMLSDSFLEMYRVLKTKGIADIIYAHKSISGWETMLNALLNAGFVVTASWPIHTEMRSRLNANATASLASSIYMICRKTKREKIGFYNEIKDQIKERVEQKLKQFWSEGISGGDFFISAIGPGMEVFSKYERVERFSGEEVSTVELLDYIRKVSTDWITSHLLHGAESSNIDKEAQFYLAFRWTYLENSVPFDDALKLANASGVDIMQHWNRDGFIQKKGSEIKVLGAKERYSDQWSFASRHSSSATEGASLGGGFRVKNMVDGMHAAVLIWESGDRKKLTEFLSFNGYQQNNAFWQFCQAVSECLLNTSKEKQLLQGFLLGKDSIRKEGISEEMQGRLF